MIYIYLFITSFSIPQNELFRIHLWLQSSDPGATHVFLFRWPGSEGKNAWSWRSHHQRTFSETARRAHLAKIHGWLVGFCKGNCGVGVGGFVGFCKMNKWRHKKKHHKEKQGEQSPIAAYSSSCAQAYYGCMGSFFGFWTFCEANFGTFKYLASQVCMRMLRSGANGSARGWTHATEQGFQ